MNEKSVFLYEGGYVEKDEWTGITERLITTKDHLGNVRAVLDTSGTVRAVYEYSPFQQPVKVAGDPAVNAPQLIIGRYYHHAPSGLHLAMYRTYDPELGRWLSEDPIEKRGGVNLYGFVGNGPVGAIDLLGLEWYDWVPDWQIPEGLVDFGARLGDGLSLGLTGLARDGFGVDSVDECSTPYAAGGVASLALGSGRLEYAGLAKAGSKLAPSGLQASAFRTRLGNAFRLGAPRPYSPNLAKYPTDDLLLGERIH